MAARKGNSQRKVEGQTASNGGQRVKWQGYINYTPTAQDKRTLRDMLSSGADPLDRLGEFLMAGYKQSLSWDSYHQAFSATLYDQNPTSPTAGFCLVARGGDPFSALTRLAFLHAYVFEGDWSKALETGKPVDEWGG